MLIYTLSQSRRFHAVVIDTAKTCMKSAEQNVRLPNGKLAQPNQGPSWQKLAKTIDAPELDCILQLRLTALYIYGSLCYLWGDCWYLVAVFCFDLTIFFR